MANNRVELATLPRYINVIPGKTDQSGLLLDTGTIALTFADLSAANIAITGTSVWTDRLQSNTLAIIESGSNGSRELRIYIRGAARSNDSWVLLNVENVDLAASNAPIDDGTIIRTYTLTVDGTADTTTIPIATWAQDTDTVIPRAKLPDTTYGDQFFFTSETTRNAGTPRYATRANAIAGTNALSGTVSWHPNDIAIVVDSGASSVYVFIGTDGASTTTNDDWLQLGQTTSITPTDVYISINNSSGTISIDHNASSTTSGGSVNATTLNLSNVVPALTLPTAYTLNVNGIQFIRGAQNAGGDYTVANNVFTFHNFTFAPIDGGDNDVVHIHGVSL